jgi:anti-anti-sigma factor
MSEHQRLDVSEVGDVTVVCFADGKLDANNIEELGGELLRLVEVESRRLVEVKSRRKLLLNFLNVAFISSEPLNNILILHKKLKSNGGSLRLCSLRPHVREVFTITKLDQLFDIKENEREGLEGF